MTSCLKQKNKKNKNKNFNENKSCFAALRCETANKYWDTREKGNWREQENQKTKHTQHKRYNTELELMYKALIGDNRLYVMEQIPKATEKQIEQIEEILM